ACRMDVLDRAVRMNAPAIQLEIRPVADCLLDTMHRPFSVLRMDAPEPLVPIRYPPCRIQPDQPVVLLGRMDDLSGRDVEGPAAGMAQSLRFRQINLGPPQVFIGTLAP